MIFLHHQPWLNLFPVFFICIISTMICFAYCDSTSWYMQQYVRQAGKKFEQKTDFFWEFEEKSNSWIEVKLPYDLVSCINDNCSKKGSINQMKNESAKIAEKKRLRNQENGEILGVRKRISLTKMSDRSIWVTGVSGSIYERFWNGVQWVIASHDLPVSAGYAIAVFMVNQTILALSEAGILYQMQLSESSYLHWLELRPLLSEETAIQLTYGVISHDKERIYFCTKNASLLELSEIDPIRWINHGKPPGADVVAIADAGTFRSKLIFTISSGGNLYEYDPSARPSWKKHIQKEGSGESTSLAPSRGCTILGQIGTQSMSLFLLTKGGDLIERRLHRRKWRWLNHENPNSYPLSSITCLSQNEDRDETSSNMFFTTAAGEIYEYRIPKQSGTAEAKQIFDNWVNHRHPPHTKAARGISGIQLQLGRMVFAMDDGRLGELHVPGLGGENVPRNQQISARRKARFKYVWSVLDAPESEGWNAEYCTEERGPSNCIDGIKDEQDTRSSIVKKRKGANAEQNYLSSSAVKSLDEYTLPENWISKNFRLRSIQGGKSFFVITDEGFLFEFLNADNVQFWLRHEYSTAIRGAIGSYNGSFFFVDENGSLLIRERGDNELGWLNCTAMRKGRRVIGGPPWDDRHGKSREASVEDAMFFVSKSGRLLQLIVALGNYRWKSCKNPPNVKIACIIDQEMFRENIVFVIGRNGRVYQYNKITELWHEHYQSRHLTLSRFPGTITRRSSLSLKGSIFMLSEDGRLVEYHWNSFDGWQWIEHGTPFTSVILVGSPGPCFGENELFLIGSDGKVYLRYYDRETWKWKDFGFPYTEIKIDGEANELRRKHGDEETCIDEDLAASFEKMQEQIHALDKDCDPKVSSTRPIPFAEDSIIFQLRDGRLAEMKRIGETNWVWSRTIGTPTSLCMANYWTATLAS